MNMHTSIQYLKGVGEKRAAKLRRLGIATLGDLISHVPRAYEDWKTIVPIAQAPIGQPVCLRAAVDYAPTEHRVRSGMILYKTRVSDASGTLNITIFNSGYQAEALKEGEEFLFYGRVTENFFVREMASPQTAPVSQARLRPIYPLTEGISSRQMETLVQRALEQTGAHIKEFIPEDMLAAYGLMGRADALRAIHRPADFDEAQRARRRLAFNELLTLQLGLRMLREQSVQQAAPPLPSKAAEAFLAMLPFKPTGAQAHAVEEAAADMALPRPMHRLLQGDVGSGKTAVAAALLYQALQGGTQGAMMAPTELLARQHYDTLQTLFAPCGLPSGTLALLVGSTPAAQKKKLKAGLADGSISLVVGTHALLEKDVRFARLGLSVVDEQHRFGVQQRNALADPADSPQLSIADSSAVPSAPHRLVMSATPIPRSLAMVIYGDLDITVLDELPPGRTPPETYCVPSAVRTRAYNYIKKHLDAGQQGYIICPRVEKSEEEDSGLASVEEFYTQLKQGAFAGYTLGLLHGKLGAKQKETVMREFASGEIQLLVATTVVEVGVDVPNAAIMVIENAERFGLSQLHQLRGRIGRGQAKSTCILISDAENEAAQARFSIMKESSDGFALAKKDLELRGPGEFFGERQHGLPPLRLADLATDDELLSQTRQAMQEILEKDPDLSLPEHQNLNNACKKLFSS